MKTVELVEIGKELLEWANAMGGWEAPCWNKLEAAVNNATKAASETAERLAEKALTAGLEAEDLYEAIHDLAASVAADVNNGGLEEQISYLIDGLGAQHTEKLLDELIEEHTNQTKEGD